MPFFTGTTPARIAVLSAFPVLLAACTSPAVVRQSETSQRREVPGQGTYQWEAKAGWVRPSRGKWGPPAQVRAEAREAFGRWRKET